MPYIKQSERPTLRNLACTMACQVKDAGELNYALSRLLREYFLQHGGRYQQINDAIGAAHGAIAEAQRTWIAEYEQKKAEENGSLDA